jgi:hypothetical protein
VPKHDAANGLPGKRLSICRAKQGRLTAIEQRAPANQPNRRDRPTSFGREQRRHGYCSLVLHASATFADYARIAKILKDELTGDNGENRESRSRLCSQFTPILNLCFFRVRSVALSVSVVVKGRAGFICGSPDRATRLNIDFALPHPRRQKTAGVAAA